MHACITARGGADGRDLCVLTSGAGTGAGASPSAGFSDRAGNSSRREAALAEAAAEGVRPGTSSLSTLVTGIVFGLQPDALFVILPALALPTKLAALAYILMFVFGTVAAMGSYTAFIGAGLCHVQARADSARRLS